MSLNSYYNKKIAKLDIMDVGLMKFAYLSISLMVLTFYPVALLMDWWAYLIIALIPAMGLWIKLFDKTTKKGLKAKYDNFMKKMVMTDLVLLFLAMFFVAAMLAVLIPTLMTVVWYKYLVCYFVLALRTITRTKSLALFM